jgi:arylsulfatase A-like enzyme
MRRRPNVLFVTLDQFRSDALGCAGHPVVRTPVLDGLAAAGVRFANHFANAAPCAPGRAALYTGTYQRNNRVVANGTPLDDRFDNVARVARRAGYAPVLFGYTDQGVDPRTVDDPDDPRLSTYEGVLPGFEAVVDLDGRQLAWLDALRARGYAVASADEALATEHERPAELSVTSFLTDAVVGWLDAQPPDRPWFAHVSYLRPHPPYCAPGHFAGRYDPAECPPALPVPATRHRLHDALLRHPGTAAPTDPADVATLRAQYYGMVTHVDEQLGRVVAAIEDRGEWDDTVVVVTADHGEQLGDQGLVQKAGFFESSYRIVTIIRSPRHGAGAGRTVESFTEAVDVLPTICELIGEPVPAQCDGLPLTPFLAGGDPPWWRRSAHYEWDWRDARLRRGVDGWPWDRRVERAKLVVQRGATHAYVHFGDGSWLCFDLAADPAWGTLTDDPVVVLGQAQELLGWQAEHLDRTMTGLLLEDGGIGRFPPGTRVAGG